MTGVLPRYAPLLLLALAWEAVTRAGLISPSALPPLDQVGAAWYGLARDGDLWHNGVSSITRGAAGLALAIGFGTAIGLLMAWYKPVQVVINPIVQFFYPMPKSALIPVMVLWLGFGDASKVATIFIGCLLPITLSAFNGARGTEQVLIWSARSLGASRWRVLWEVVLPSALPELLSGIRTALALSFVLLVASGADRRPRRARLHDRLARRWRRLRCDVRGGVDRGAVGLCRRPGLSDAGAAGSGVARMSGADTSIPVRTESGLRLDRLLSGWGQRIAGVLPLIAVVVAWEGLARSHIMTAYLLPPLSVVLEQVWQDVISGDLFINLGQTLYRALAGFAIAAVGGVALGIVMSRSKIVRWFFDPIVSVGFPMPKIAFLPIFMLWLGLYDVSKISMAVFNAIFPVITATMGAAEGVDRYLVWSARSLGASERQLLREIILPAALPQILTGLQVALPISMIVMIVTEMLMGGEGSAAR